MKWDDTKCCPFLFCIMMNADPEKLGTPERVEKLKSVLSRRQTDITIVLENVDDPHNVSAVLRSCDATGILNVHLVYRNDKFPSLGERSSASARKWVHQIQHDSIEGCYNHLRNEGKTILTTHLTSSAIGLYEVDFTKPLAIVFGNEHSGVTEEAISKADGNMLIPQAGIVQSLNISVACAVTLFEAYRQRMKAGLYDQPQLTSEVLNDTLCEWLMK